MGPILITLGILFAVFLLIAFWIIGMYNRLVTLRNRYKNAYAQIDVQLKRRYDLIPNLVETCKGYMKHESETLQQVTMYRNQAAGANAAAAKDPGNPEAMKDLVQAEGNLGGALGRLLVTVEAYPELKANENMLSLQEELTSTENKVAFARQAYNDAVMFFNNAREVFPSNIVAGMFNFAEASLFEITEEKEKEAPKVSFS